MTKYEYHTDNRIRGAQYAVSEIDWLNRLGQQGWELCAVSEPDTEAKTYYFFKRALPDVGT